MFPTPVVADEVALSVGTADAPCDEGQDGQDHRRCCQCWGHLEKGRAEKMLSPTLPRPGVALPSGHDAHPLQDPFAGTDAAGAMEHCLR